MFITSIPSDYKDQHSAVVSFHIKDSHKGPSQRLQEILTKLRSLSLAFKNLKVSASSGSDTSQFKASFDLRKRFADEACEFVEALFRILGVRDDDGSLIEGYTIETDTMYPYAWGWISKSDNSKLNLGHIRENEVTIVLMPDISPLI